MQINLKTILISMVVAFLLFTADGKEVLGFVFLVASDPLGLLNDRELLKMFVVPVAAVLAYVYRREIVAWWRSRQLGKRIY